MVFKLFICCMTCGCPIERSSSAFEYSIYRALYWTQKGARLTEPAVNYDGKAYYGESCIPVGHLRRCEQKRSNFDTRYIQDVFLFHRACWAKLVEYFGSRKINLDILFDACQKAPKSNAMYYRSDAENILAPFVGATSPMTPPLPRIPWYDVGCHLVRVALEILEKAWHPDPVYVAPGYSIHPPFDDPPITDPFVLLPMDICIEIACLLPTADFHNFRLASRKMYPIFHEQGFWKSRFSHVKDRQYIDGPDIGTHITKSSHDMDWRGLYRRTVNKPRELEKLLQIRMINARMNFWLYEAMMHPTAKPSDGPSRVDCLSGSLARSCDRQIRDLNYRQLVHRPVFETKTCLPLMNATVNVWVVRNAGTTYISGLSFLVDDRVPVSFGYRTDEEPVTLKASPLNYLWCAYSANAASLVAIAVSSTNRKLVWAGEPKLPGQSLRACHRFFTWSGRIAVACDSSRVAFLSTPQVDIRQVTV